MIDYRNAGLQVDTRLFNLYLEKANLGVQHAKDNKEDYQKSLNFLTNYDEKVSIAKSIIDRDEDFKDCKYLNSEFWKIKRKMFTLFYNDFTVDSDKLV